MIFNNVNTVFKDGFLLEPLNNIANSQSNNYYTAFHCDCVCLLTHSIILISFNFFISTFCVVAGCETQLAVLGIVLMDNILFKLVFNCVEFEHYVE